MNSVLPFAVFAHQRTVTPGQRHTVLDLDESRFL